MEVPTEPTARIFGLTIAEAVASAIALAAWILTIYQAIRSRRHDRLLSRPHAVLSLDLKDSRGIKISFRNAGPGPAILSSLEASVQGGDFFRLTTESWAGLLIFLGPTGEVTYVNSNDDFQSVVAPGQEDAFMEIRTSGEEFKRIVLALQQIVFRVKFESVYGERMDATVTAQPNLLQAMGIPEATSDTEVDHEAEDNE